MEKLELIKMQTPLQMLILSWNIIDQTGPKK